MQLDKGLGIDRRGILVVESGGVDGCDSRSYSLVYDAVGIMTLDTFESPSSFGISLRYLAPRALGSVLLV